MNNPSHDVVLYEYKISMNKNAIRIRDLIEKLVGESITIKVLDYPRLRIEGESLNIGFSQMNEILLLHGFDRISKTFFQYLVNQETTYDPKSKITSFDQLEYGIEEFRKIAILWWGNIKKAFKTFAKDPPSAFLYTLESLRSIDIDDYRVRHNQLLELIDIPAADTYYLGYMIEKELKQKEKQHPDDPEILKEKEKRERIIELGLKNQRAYLTSDHLDVYIATSMRLEHEYIFVNKTVKRIFSQGPLKPLNLRYFDPTQAYCKDRIDKGLSEGLMLKRAKCTVYLAQESDTLGKDSELATTLAQGKPVIAYIPTGNKLYVDDLIKDLAKIHPERTQRQIMINQLQVFRPSLAWGSDDISKQVRTWIDDDELAIENEVKYLLYKIVKEHYDKRANTLKEDHPLGLQVNLETGVATGVFVVRTLEDCAKLIRSIVLKEIMFKLSSERNQYDLEYTYLKEDISGCIFRVITGDKLLTNAFWNFYLEPNQN